jgi:hypothetical protein
MTQPDVDLIAELLQALRYAHAEIHHPGFNRDSGRDIDAELQRALDMANKRLEKTNRI